MKDIQQHTKDTIEELLEEITKHSEGNCPFCFAEDFPVKGDKSGYDEVSSDEAEEWNLEHCLDCLVLDLEKAHSKIK